MTKRIQRRLLLFIGIAVISTAGCHKTKESATPETGTVTDIDGNVYSTVKIGDQWWMAENLRVTRYRDGSAVQALQTDTAKWNHDTVGAYCVCQDDPNSPGLLYNWYAVANEKKIAPAGWHVPGDNEWKLLEVYLGMFPAEADKVNFRGEYQGDKLKMQGQENWYPRSGIWATNASGFSAQAGGCRMFNGTWGDPGLRFTGFWWTSSEHAANQEAWYRHLDYKKPNVFRYYGPKTYGFSIRCVKD